MRARPRSCRFSASWDSPTEGRYLLNGEAVEQLSATERRDPQPRDRLHLPGLQPDRRPHGLRQRRAPAHLPGHLRGGTARAGPASLDRVGMASRMDHYPSQLSGGQQQRVAVARAIVGRPRVILADEPTGNLDSGNGRAVMKLLEELHADGATICMVTHDPRYAHAARAHRPPLRRPDRGRGRDPRDPRARGERVRAGLSAPDPVGYLADGPRRGTRVVPVAQGPAGAAGSVDPPTA